MSGVSRGKRAGGKAGCRESPVGTENSMQSLKEEVNMRVHPGNARPRKRRRGGIRRGWVGEQGPGSKGLRRSRTRSTSDRSSLSCSILSCFKRSSVLIEAGLWGGIMPQGLGATVRAGRQLFKGCPARPLPVNLRGPPRQPAGWSERQVPWQEPLTAE